MDHPRWPKIAVLIGCAGVLSVPATATRAQHRKPARPKAPLRLDLRFTPTAGPLEKLSYRLTLRNTGRSAIPLYRDFRAYVELDARLVTVSGNSVRISPRALHMPDIHSSGVQMLPAGAAWSEVQSFDENWRLKPQPTDGAYELRFIYTTGDAVYSARRLRFPQRPRHVSVASNAVLLEFKGGQVRVRGTGAK
jgi:hypothetical protein